jgi:hypothetical protein
MGLFGKSYDGQIRELDERLAKLEEKLERMEGQLKEQGEVLFDIEVALGLKKRERTIVGTAVQVS